MGHDSCSVVLEVPKSKSPSAHHFQAIAIGRSESRPYTGEAMAGISITGLAVIFRRFQVQHHHPITLSRVLYVAFTGGFDPKMAVTAE